MPKRNVDIVLNAMLDQTVNRPYKVTRHLHENEVALAEELPQD